MPLLQVTTKSATSSWKSPDGQREIWEVVMDYKGQAVKAQTFSGQIAEPGWSGEVESYERGNHTFVRQAPKEGGFTGGGQQRNATPTASSKPSYSPKDEKAIQAMWAIGQAVQLALPGKEPQPTEWVEATAHKLFAMVDRVKSGIPPVNVSVDFAGSKPDEVVDDVPVDMAALDAMFPDIEQLSIPEEENPWPKTAS